MERIRSCSICDGNGTRGILLLEQWICTQCINELLEMDPSNPNYKHYMEKVKNIWKSHYPMVKNR